MSWDGHADIVTLGYVTRKQRIFFGDSVSKTPVRKHMSIWDSNIKMEFYDLNKIRGCGMVLFGSE